MNIRKIAERAGVSVATISRVLNHPDLVSPETRERVYAVMKESQYTPNWFARNLTQKQTRTIAFLYPSNDSTFLQAVADGVEIVALNKKNLVFLCHTNGTAEMEQEYLELMVQRNVDGIILFSTRLPQEKIDQVTRMGIPCVHIGHEGADIKRKNCFINYTDAAAKLTDHMIQLGYMQIYLLLDNMLVNEADEIKEGFEHAVEKAPVKPETDVFVADRSVQGGMLFAHRMIQTGKMPRALITSSARQAFGVMKAARLAGIRIPEDLAIASMTDSSVSTLIDPPLTAVDRPGKRLGMVTARMLFDCIENREFTTQTAQHVELLAKLAIRKSCGNKKFIYELFE